MGLTGHLRNLNFWSRIEGPPFEKFMGEEELDIRDLHFNAKITLGAVCSRLWHSKSGSREKLFRKL